MRPVLFQVPESVPLLGGAPVFSYGVLLGAAYVLAWFVALRMLPTDLRGPASRIYIWTGLLGWAGSRLLGPSVDGGTPLVGGTLWPGLLVAAVVVAVTSRRLSPADRWRLVDGASTGTAFGVAVGRLGCFIHGCDYGVPWSGPGAVTWPSWSGAFGDVALGGAGVPRVPVQLLESGLSLGLGLALVRVRARPGARAALFFAGYAVTRLGLEALRGDADRGTSVMGSGLSVGQVTSLGVLVALAAWLWRRRGASVA